MTLLIAVAVYPFVYRWLRRLLDSQEHNQPLERPLCDSGVQGYPPAPTTQPGPGPGDA